MYKLPGCTRFRKGKPSAEELRQIQREKRLEKQRKNRWMSKAIPNIFYCYSEFDEDDGLTEPPDLQSVDSLLRSMCALTVSPPLLPASMPSTFDMVDGQSRQTCGQQALWYNNGFGSNIDATTASPEVKLAIDRQRTINYLQQVRQHLNYHRQLSYKPVNNKAGIDLTRRQIPILEKWPAKVDSIGQLLNSGFTNFLIQVIRKIPTDILFKDEEMINLIVSLLALITSMVTQEDAFYDPDFLLLEFYAGLVDECSDLNSILSPIVFNTLCYAGNLLTLQPQAWNTLLKRNFASVLLNQAHQVASLMKDTDADGQPFLLSLAWSMCNFFAGFETCSSDVLHSAASGLVTSPSNILSEAAGHIIPLLGYFIQFPDVKCKTFILSTLKCFSSPESHHMKHLITNQNLIETIVQHLAHPDHEVVTEASTIISNISCYNECAQYLVTELNYLSFIYHLKTHASSQLFTTLANISAGGVRTIQHIIQTHGLIDVIMEGLEYADFRTLQQIFLLMRNITNLGNESQIRPFIDAGLIPCIGIQLRSGNLDSDTIKVGLEILDKIFYSNEHAGYQQLVRKQCQEGHLLAHLNWLFNSSQNQVLLAKIKKILDYLDFQPKDDSLNYDDPNFYASLDESLCSKAVATSNSSAIQQPAYIFW